MSARRVSGCSTTSTSSRTTPRRFGRASPAATTGSCQSCSTGRWPGYPRVYELATTLISHTEGRVDLETLNRFVAAFQEVAPLDIGELWALPAMLRLGLIESVRRMTLRTVQRLDALAAADAWAERLHQAEVGGPTALALAMAEFSESTAAPTPNFVVRLLDQLRRNESPAALESLEHWIEEEATARRRPPAG